MLDPVADFASRRRREVAVAVAAIVLLPIFLVNGPVLGLGGPPPPAPVTFPDVPLYAGEVNTLSLTFRDPAAVIEMPEGFFPIIRGMIVPQRNVSSGDLVDGRLMFLVPPALGNLTFNVTSRLGPMAHTYEVLRGREPVVSGEDTVANLESITQAYQFRFSGSPKLLAFAEHARAFFTGLGLDAQMYFYPWEVARRPILRDQWINLIVVCGFQQGLEAAGEWIVIGAHMDSVPQAIEGAYDDGSGTAALLEVAQGMSKFKTAHTLVYCLWGGEEEGLYGSNAWVDREATGNLVFYINMDMAGLSWPAPFNFTAFVGPDEDEGTAEHPKTVSLLENMTQNELRYPREGNFSLIEDPFGRSDHVSFWGTGATTVFFFGADDIEYPDYHSRDDTLATMTQLAGGREMLVAGFDTLVWMAVYLLIHADNHETD